MPLAAPVCNRSIPQFPIPPKSLKTQGLRNKPCTGTFLSSFMSALCVCTPLFAAIWRYFFFFFWNSNNFPNRWLSNLCLKFFLQWLKKEKAKWNKTEFRKRPCIYSNLYIVEVMSEVRRDRMVCLVNEIHWLLYILQGKNRSLPHNIYKGMNSKMINTWKWKAKQIMKENVREYRDDAEIKDCFWKMKKFDNADYSKIKDLVQ